MVTSPSHTEGVRVTPQYYHSEALNKTVYEHPLDATFQDLLAKLLEEKANRLELNEPVSELDPSTTGEEP